MPTISPKHRKRTTRAALQIVATDHPEKLAKIFFPDPKCLLGSVPWISISILEISLVVHLLMFCTIIQDEEKNIFWISFPVCHWWHNLYGVGQRTTSKRWHASLVLYCHYKDSIELFGALNWPKLCWPFYIWSKLFACNSSKYYNACPSNLKIFFMAVQYWHGQTNVAKWPDLIALDNIYLSPKMEPIGPILNQGLSSFIFTQRFIMYFSSQQLEWVIVWPSLIIVGEDYIAWDDVAKIALQKKPHIWTPTWPF